MKKKSLVMMVVSLALVGTIMVGATLAYFTDKTDAVTNTFTVGANVEIDLFENVVQTTSANQIYVTTTSGNDLTHVPAGYGAAFNKMYPGLVLDKAPFVEIAETSSDCYIRTTVTGVDTLESQGFTVAFNTTNWSKVGGAGIKDGIYQYNGKLTNVVPAKLATEALFTTVTYNSTNKELPNPNASLSNIVVKAYAIQADGFADATTAFNSERGGTTTSEIDDVLMRP